MLAKFCNFFVRLKFGTSQFITRKRIHQSENSCSHLVELLEIFFNGIKMSKREIDCSVTFVHRTLDMAGSCGCRMVLVTRHVDDLRTGDDDEDNLITRNWLICPSDNWVLGYGGC